MAATVQRMAAAAWSKVPGVRMPARLKGGRLERWVDYWINMGFDYKDSFVTIGKQMKQRPTKAAVYITACSAAVYLNHTNPNERDLRSRLQEHLNGTALMTSVTRSSTRDAQLNHLIDCFNNNTLRRLNLVCFSLAWQDNYNSECAVYKATVSHLKPRYFTFIQDRVLDVGFLGRWWHLEHIVSTIDINEEEWDDHGKQRQDFKSKRSRTLGLI